MMNKIKECICVLFSYISDYFTDAKQKRLVSQQNAQKQYIYNSAQQLHQQIQFELFLALGNNHYTNLHPITMPNHIRLHQWFISQGTFIFQYRLSAHNIPAHTLLDLMRQNMNTDIYQCQQNLLNTHPFEVIEILYPCIFWGLYIINIQSVGNDIVISVVTNFK